jgi:hypothetical protein
MMVKLRLGANRFVWLNANHVTVVSVINATTTSVRVMGEDDEFQIQDDAEDVVKAIEAATTAGT